jgi:hypothetical protein
MNEGLKIVLERMRTNPEEFGEDSKKWRWINGFADALDADELKALAAGKREALRELFTRKVMATLVDIKLDLDESESMSQLNAAISGVKAAIGSGTTRGTAISNMSYKPNSITTSTDSPGKLILSHSELIRLKAMMKEVE